MAKNGNALNFQVENAEWQIMIVTCAPWSIYILKTPLALRMKRVYANIYVIWILNANELLFVVIDAVVVSLLFPFCTLSPVSVLTLFCTVSEK